jgi:DNA-binding transcriptional ArsR family regulator
MRASKAAKRNTDRLDVVLAALADPYRREVVDYLRERPHRAGELAERAGLTAPAMSRHLRTLRETGLVEERHDGVDARVRIYALKSGAMDDLRDWLAETEAMWTAQLSALKAHLEKGDKRK